MSNPERVSGVPCRLVDTSPPAPMEAGLLLPLLLAGAGWAVTVSGWMAWTPAEDRSPGLDWMSSAGR